MIKMNTAILVFCALFSASTFASFNCVVALERILIYKTGMVNVLHSGRGDYTSICNLKEEKGGVSIATCAMWTSMLQSIKKEKGQAIFYYAGEGNCATLPTYGSSPTPEYIGVL
ncbi:hypothetical protein [Shewanella surugensis]|uniref:Uncharacterized protein n=1 Tax=Shewanella surugensis TaxID=212020 RepID=A0ABT0LAB9_9GAMM|nr:hypothetical protein [Shewanella surugensis]MCL1124631.1 hypothetical protein [Shewanella surugensis]